MLKAKDYTLSFPFIVEENALQESSFKGIYVVCVALGPGQI